MRGSEVVSARSRTRASLWWGWCRRDHMGQEPMESTLDLEIHFQEKMTKSSAFHGTNVVSWRMTSLEPRHLARLGGGRLSEAPTALGVETIGRGQAAGGTKRTTKPTNQPSNQRNQASQQASRQVAKQATTNQRFGSVGTPLLNDERDIGVLM